MTIRAASNLDVVCGRETVGGGVPSAGLVSTTRGDTLAARSLFGGIAAQEVLECCDASLGQPVGLPITQAQAACDLLNRPAFALEADDSFFSGRQAVDDQAQLNSPLKQFSPINYAVTVMHFKHSRVNPAKAPQHMPAIAGNDRR